MTTYLRRAASLLLACSVLLPFSGAQGRALGFGDVRVFAEIPPPGNPEETVVVGNTAYFGTTVGGDGLVAGDGQPSKIFGFHTGTGELVREITVEGENVNGLHGIAGMAVDAKGRLYAASVSHGILRFDLRNGAKQSLYAELPDLPPCREPLVQPPCSPTPEDRAPLGNGIVFDRDGSLYVADSFQATIFRIPSGGGKAKVWFSDPQLHGLFGANGIKISPDRKHIYFTVTGNLARQGYVYRLPRVKRPVADHLEVVHDFGEREPDGLAFGRSGRLYVVLGTGGLAILTDDDEFMHEIQSDLFHNPSSLGFDGKGNALVTNHAFFEIDPSRHTVVAVDVLDRAHRLERPKIP
jgi:sugar lactone lactonase YvrE